MNSQFKTLLPLFDLIDHTHLQQDFFQNVNRKLLKKQLNLKIMPQQPRHF